MEKTNYIAEYNFRIIGQSSNGYTTAYIIGDNSRNVSHDDLSYPFYFKKKYG
jgi:hypothetical protein